MSEVCRWLHQQLEQLPMISHPFNEKDLPENGIYFFYEQREAWGHGELSPRIVRIGTHAGQGNLRRCINDTYVLDERRLNFSEEQPRAADWGSTRKNIGRALLNKDGGCYLDVWDIDFIPRQTRDRFRHLRDLEKEKRLEKAISRLLRQRFCFRFIIVDDPTERRELEKRLIGTVAGCKVCTPSENWLGRASPRQKISDGNLWQVRNLKADPLGSREKDAVLRAINLTRM